MNRYPGPPSKATASTTCQRCLKKGHYSYECKTPAQSRPYASRPSRTQQLQNPKLKPKLDSDTPNELLRKTGVADEQLAKAEEERGRKRRRLDGSHSSSRSTSTASASGDDLKSPASKLTESNQGAIEETDHTEPFRTGVTDRDLPKSESQTSPRPERRRSTERRHKHHHPVTKHLRSRSRSPHHDHEISHRQSKNQDRSLSPDRIRGNHDDGRRRRHSRQRSTRDEPAVPRKRSLSPYSRRLALTQSMNL